MQVTPKQAESFTETIKEAVKKTESTVLDFLIDNNLISEDALNKYTKLKYGDTDYKPSEEDVYKEAKDRGMYRFLNEAKGGKAFNKGGMPTQMQMAFMDEGGLKDEGGEIDPESGNEVPSGSLKKEVRDDMPTMLSEGEFVFPADVVRYIGLEKLMKLRQDAKQGLKMMEEMGQMGNADEATIPDDLPFGMADLVVITGGKDEPKEMAEGGVLTGQQGLFADPRFAGQGVSPTQRYTPAQIENIRSGLGGQFQQIEQDIKDTDKTKTDQPVVAQPEQAEVLAPETDSKFDRRRSETRGFNKFIEEQEGHGGAFSTIKQYADRDAVDWLKAATDINSLAGDIVTKLPIVGDLVSMSYKGALDEAKKQLKEFENGTRNLDSDTKFALDIFVKSKKPKGILSVLKDIFQGKTLKEAFTPEEYKQLTETELAEIQRIRDKAKLEAKKRRDEYNNMSAADRTQRRQFLNVGVYNDGSGTIIQMKGDQVLYQTGGRNVYVNISDIIKQGDDPSLLMERILQKKPTFDSSGQYTGLSDAKPLPAYVQENATIGDKIEKETTKTIVPTYGGTITTPEEDRFKPYTTESTEVTDVTPPVSPYITKGPEGLLPQAPESSVQNILDEAASSEAPKIEIPDTTGEGEGPPLDAPELIDPDITDLEKTSNIITLPDGTEFDTTGYSQEQIDNLFPKKVDNEKVSTSAPASVSLEQSTVKPTEYASKGLEFLGESGIVDKVKDFGSSLFDSIKSSFAKGREEQEERDRILAETIRKNKIARQDAARDAEVEQAKKDSASQALKKQTVASGKIDIAEPFQNLSTKVSPITGESEKDVVDRIRRRQKDEAYKAAVALKNQQPTYVPPTAPTIKYDAPAGPFAKGGLAKMKAKKPAKKRKGGLASKKK
tara:strand:- start:2175 stop:4847 length:2673 start_codon:yes stop_codon:yes gene_type:complete